MYGLGQNPPMLPHPAAMPGQMNPSYPQNNGTLPGYPTATPAEGSYAAAISNQAAAYANNAATSQRGTPPTIGYSQGVYPQGATAYGAAYGAPTYHGSSSYPYSAAYSSASTASPYNPSSYSQQSRALSSAYTQAAAAQQQGMVPAISMIQGVPRTVYVTDTRATVPSSAGLMSGAALGTTSQHAAAAAAQAAYYQQQQPGTWQQQQQQAAAVAAVQQQQAAQQPHRTYNPNPYAPHW